MSDLLLNSHEGLSSPTNNGQTVLIRGYYQYYHYACDGFKDMGWGCGYRTLQTICSWIKNAQKNEIDIPNIKRIQQILFDIGDKSFDFVGSKDWIGSFEVCLVLDHLYDVPSKIIHVISGAELRDIIKDIVNHFTKFGSPVMMGGDQDCSSKGVLGVHINGEDIYLLILDPHFVGKKSVSYLQDNGWIKWQNISDFNNSSFYNICLPQITTCNK